MSLSPLPNDRTLDRSKFKSFVDDTLILSQMVRPVFYKIENIVGKGENAGIKHFFPTMFSKGFFLTTVETQDYFVKG